MEKALRYCYLSAFDEGVKEHAQVVMKKLGITHYDCEACPIADCWLFYVKDWPDMELPKYITKVEI